MITTESCPFCGFDELDLDEFLLDYGIETNPMADKRYATSCTGCGARGPECKTEEEAGKAWDKRLSSKPTKYMEAFVTRFLEDLN